jgi:hypothetical protein
MINTFLPLKGKSSPSPHFRMMADMKVTSYGVRRTLGHLVQHQLTLWMHCRKCRRAAKLDVRQLAETHGAKIELKEVLAGYICENCGAVWPYIDVEVPPRPRKRVA